MIEGKEYTLRVLAQGGVPCEDLSCRNPLQIVSRHNRESLGPAIRKYRGTFQYVKEDEISIEA